ncbi:MAG: hypothetical protein D6765_14115 [Bacteroidetes bacterium]|nr:MAG: hypothetical protein D6765_14115 [Bacteroidota bacterium]
MREKQPIDRFHSEALPEEESLEIKGGRSSTVPGSTGSTGIIIWDDVDIRGQHGLIPPTFIGGR